MTGQEYTIIGILVVAVGTLWKLNVSYNNSMEKQRDQAQKQLQEQHQKEQERLLEELKIMKCEQADERKEYLERLDRFDESLRENTAVLKTVAEKIEVVPNMQKKLIELDNDVKGIKTCIGAC